MIIPFLSRAKARERRSGVELPGTARRQNTSRESCSYGRMTLFLQRTHAANPRTARRMPRRSLKIRRIDDRLFPRLIGRGLIEACQEEWDATPESRHFRD